MSRRLTRNLTAALITLGVSGSAYAGPVTFTFDATSSPSCSALAGGAGPSAIQSYMNCVLGGTYVTSVSSGAVAQNGAAPGTTGTVAGTGPNSGYTGDGHAVGAGANPSTSLTLGNTNGATVAGGSLVAGAADTFIMTDMSSTQFSFQFGNGFTIAAGSVISFDYQIFPNGDCPILNSANCGGAMSGGHYPNEPDFKFKIDGSQVGSTMYGVTPGTGGTYSDSPVSGSPELAPQKMGVFTYTVGAALVNPLLTFVDWPATIGIDNLKVTYSTPPVPEPITLTLMGLGMVGLRTYRRRVVA